MGRIAKSPREHLEHLATAPHIPPGGTGGLPTSEPHAARANTNSTLRKPPASPELTALRWMVRIFFVAFAVLRLLSACGVEISLAGELSILIGGLLVIAHMAATVIGTTRRNAAPDEPPADQVAWAIERRRLAAGALAARLPRPNALRGDLPYGLGSLAFVVIGALTAAALMAAATFPAWLRIGFAGVLILELSAATIGAYFGYMTARLTATLKTAWAEAASELQTNRSPNAHY